MKKLFVLIGAAVLLVSCGRKVINEGTLTLENGKQEKVEIPFTCIGCVENISAVEEFDKIVEDVSTAVKARMSHPLSYIPTKLSMTIERKDSTISYHTNEPFPNLLKVGYTMGYIAQNSYGVEKEGDIEDILHLSDGKEVDLYKDAKLPPVTLVRNDDSDYSMPNRSLAAFGLQDEDAFIEVSPLFDEKGDLFLHISCNISCIDEGNRFYIGFEDEKTMVLNNIQRFNCEGKAIVKVSQEQKEELASKKVLLISLYTKNDKAVCSVPANRADYFQQVLNLDLSK